MRREAREREGSERSDDVGREWWWETGGRIGSDTAVDSSRRHRLGDGGAIGLPARPPGTREVGRLQAGSTLLPVPPAPLLASARRTTGGG
nr:hypothetical protein StreXyl84_47270 [Streptomyces sp. Xyl84]